MLSHIINSLSQNHIHCILGSEKGGPGPPGPPSKTATGKGGISVLQTAIFVYVLKKLYGKTPFQYNLSRD